MRISTIRLAVMVLTTVAGAHAAASQEFDLARASCADFSGMNANDRSQLSLWLAGYYAGAAQRPTLDLGKIAAAPDLLEALCSKTPQAPLIGTETRAVFASAP